MALLRWMEPIPSCPLPSFAQPLPVSSANPCSLNLFRVLFASKSCDHALCCKKSGDRITRHNRLRNLVFKLADTGLLRPEMEKLGILGPTDKSRRRPGDVSIKDWSAAASPLTLQSSVPSRPLIFTLRSPVSRTLSIRKSIDTPLLSRSLITTSLP